MFSMLLPASSHPSMQWLDQPVELRGDPRQIVRVMRNGQLIPLGDIIRMNTLYGIDAETDLAMDALGMAIGQLVLKRFPAASNRTLTEIAVSCILRSLHIRFTAKHINMGERFDLHWFGRTIPLDPAIEYAMTHLLTAAIHTITTPYTPTIEIALKPPASHITIHP